METVDFQLIPIFLTMACEFLTSLLNKRKETSEMLDFPLKLF
jgi:hypothetical protein